MENRRSLGHGDPAIAIRALVIVATGTLLLSGCSSLPKVVGHRDPLTPAEHNTLGDAYVQKNEKQAAIRQYEAALRKDKHNVSALLALGNVAFESKDYPLARRYYDRLAKIHPQDPAGINNIAMVDLAEGKNLDRSRKKLEEILPLAGTMKPYLWDTLANIAIRENRLLDAQKAVHEARQVMPTNDPQFAMNLALTEEKIKGLTR